MSFSFSSSFVSSSPGHRARGCFTAASADSDDLLLLCGEDAGSFYDEEDGEDSRQLRRGLLLPPRRQYADVDDKEEEEEEVVATWVGVEGDYSPAMGYRARFLALPGSLDPDARRLAAAWILKVRKVYSFQPTTAYLAVNYMDRFLSRHSLPVRICSPLPQTAYIGQIPTRAITAAATGTGTGTGLFHHFCLPLQPRGWPMQLLCVTCLSLAVKMEETLVPSLLDLQVEDARFVFEPRTIQRMELLVLDALDWRLRSITPFTFLGFFACRADPSKAYTRCMVSRATHIILDTVEEVEFLDLCPSAMAAAAIICAASDVSSLPFLSPDSAASWCDGLTTDGIVNCQQLMKELVVGRGWKQQRRPGVLPQLRITSSVSMGSGVLSSSSSSSSNKRRKLSSCRWVGDRQGRPMGEGGGIN
ncbi:hypothetical protein Taro_050561 [Colocasia esculenta]|uniref:Cyclin C-terminal domain-containing protein n=1 Tax=Colocasia esculenta TaxID=4460 RepID=A0A843XDT1_COLES|nr:hypothetical protein [Colocasia esculenta]